MVTELLELMRQVVALEAEVAAKTDELRRKRAELERLVGAPPAPAVHRWTALEQSVPAGWLGSTVQGLEICTPSAIYTYSAQPKMAGITVSSAPTLSARIVDCLYRNPGAMTPMEIAQDLKEPEKVNVVRATLSRLAADGRVHKVGHGKYVRPPLAEFDGAFVAT